MGQILIDFFGHSLYPVGWETVEKPFVIIFGGFKWLFTYIYPYTVSNMLKIKRDIKEHDLKIVYLHFV